MPLGFSSDMLSLFSWFIFSYRFFFFCFCKPVGSFLARHTTTVVNQLQQSCIVPNCNINDILTLMAFDLSWLSLFRCLPWLHVILDFKLWNSSFALIRIKVRLWTTSWFPFKWRNLSFRKLFAWCLLVESKDSHWFISYDVVRNITCFLPEDLFVLNNHHLLMSIWLPYFGSWSTVQMLFRNFWLTLTSVFCILSWYFTHTFNAQVWRFHSWTSNIFCSFSWNVNDVPLNFVYVISFPFQYKVVALIRLILASIAWANWNRTLFRFETYGLKASYLC